MHAYLTLPCVNIISCIVTFVVGYFAGGMGITDARKYHQSKLELQDDFSESMLADARMKPTYRTVLQWHTTWRAAHLGPASSSGVLEVSAIVDVASVGVRHRPRL